MRFHAHIRENRMEIIENERFSKYLRGKVGDLITLDIERVRSIRSMKENKYYHGVVIPILSDYFGYEPSEIHDILKTNFLKEKRRVKSDRRKVITMIRSTTSLTTLEFEDFLDRVRVWALQQFAIIIPLPHQTGPSQTST